MRQRLAFATVLLASAKLVHAATTWTVPGTVDVSGLNGTRFVSDLAVTNPGAAPVLASVALVPASGTTPATITLAPGQTVVTRGVLQQLWSVSGAGATVITAASPLLIRARTYNTAASGTYGVALPVIPDDRFLAEGDAGESLWVSQSADVSKGYRTNVAVFFPDAGGGDATVTVYDAAGTSVGSQDYSLTAPGFQQFAVGSFAGAVDVGRAELVVTRGRAGGYAVVVDNVTGDSSLFAFEDLPAGRQDVLVNGVARASGRLGTFFRTDARLYNPTDTDATVTVAFHANQAANPNPASGSFSVPAGGLLDIVDVLQTFLGLPVGSAGALRFTSDAPVAILCRTSNVDPAGVTPGTFGAQQKPVPVLSFLTTADAGAVVTGIRQGAAFRTNTGFAAGANGASWTLTLKDASGATVGTATGSLGAWGWTQPNVQDLFPGVTVPADATLQVNVTVGSVDVYDSSIDNSSGDSVVTPIMPLPAAIPSSATIGPAGGSVQSSDGRFTLLVPAGALASPMAISIGAASSDAPQGVGPEYLVSPSSVVFAEPVLVRLSYGADDLAGSTTAALSIAYHLSGSWVSLGDGLLDPGRRTLTVAIPGGGPGAAARRTEAGLSDAFAILRAWEIVPKTAVVLGGGTAHFSAYYAGPPSTTICLTPFCHAAITSPYGVNVQWGVQGDSSFGTVSPYSGTSTTFTASCTRVGVVPVFFAIGFGRLPGLPPVSFRNGRGTATVFARQWQVSIEENNTSDCPYGGSFSRTSKIVDAFLLQDGGGPVLNLHKVDGAHSTSGSPTCGPPGCAWTSSTSFTDTSIQSATGTLTQYGIDFVVNWTSMASTPKATFSCYGTTDSKDEIPGLPNTSGPYSVQVHGGSFPEGALPTNDFQVKLVPVAGCN